MRVANTVKELGSAFALSALIAACGSAGAQTSFRGVPADRLDQKAPPLRTPPHLARRGRHRVAGKSAAPAPALAPAAVPFRVSRVVVDGSTLDPAALTAAARPFIGVVATDKTLSALADAMAVAYGESDIALYSVAVPDQDYAGGTVRLVAVEGRVSSVEVRGKVRKKQQRLLADYLARITAERPLHKRTLQRTVSLIRDIPGLTSDLSFEQTESAGDVTLVVNAKDKAIQVAVGVNNRGTALLGRTQVETDVYANGLLTGGDQLHAAAVLPTHVSRFQYYAGAYSAPIGANGTSASANLSYLRTRPHSVPLKGSAWSFGGQLGHAIVRDYDHSLTATIGADGINTNNALLGYRLSNDRVRAVRTGLAYTGSGTRNLVSLSATASFGLDVLGARVVKGQAKARFRKLNVKAADNLQLGKSFVLRLNTTAQVTSDDLPASEQIALGGDEFGRAYEAALIAGDRGIAGSAELAWHPASGLPKQLSGSELYIFSDGGRVWSEAREFVPAVRFDLASIGAGARLSFDSRLIFQVEVVRGLLNPVSYEDREKARLLFSVRSAL